MVKKKELKKKLRQAEQDIRADFDWIEGLKDDAARTLASLKEAGQWMDEIEAIAQDLAWSMLSGGDQSADILKLLAIIRRASESKVWFS